MLDRKERSQHTLFIPDSMFNPSVGFATFLLKPYTV